MNRIKYFLLLGTLFIMNNISAQTVVKMDMPEQADEPLNVVALFDEELPEGIQVVLGLMGYEVEGGTTPYLFEWLLNGEVISTTDIAVFTPGKGDDLTLKVIDNNKCRATTSFNLKVASIPGTDSEDKDDIKIYPTIVNEYIHFEFPSSNGDKAWMRIFDINGKLIQENYLSESMDINIGLISGTYFVSLKIGDRNKVQKIIAQ